MGGAASVEISVVEKHPQFSILGKVKVAEIYANEKTIPIKKALKNVIRPNFLFYIIKHYN